ncbi:hypothetical protein quinque_011829 [Culex quinquefasciatus]
MSARVLSFLELQGKLRITVNPGFASIIRKEAVFRVIRLSTASAICGSFGEIRSLQSPFCNQRVFIAFPGREWNLLHYGN